MKEHTETGILRTLVTPNYEQMRAIYLFILTMFGAIGKTETNEAKDIHSFSVKSYWILSKILLLQQIIE